MGGAPLRLGSYLPERTSDTVPEALGQTHCARGAAAGGLRYTRPFIRVTAPPTLAEGQPEAARGRRGAAPRALLPSTSWASKKSTRPPGRDPATLPLDERKI